MTNIIPPLTLGILFFMPVFKYYGGATVQALPILAVCLWAYAKSNAAKIGSNTIIFILFTFLSIILSMILSFFHLSSYFFTEFIRYLYVAFIAISFYVLCKNATFDWNAFKKVFVFTSIFLNCIFLFLGAPEAESLTYSQLSYSLIPFVAIGIHLIAIRKNQILGGIIVVLGAVVSLTYGARSVTVVIAFLLIIVLSHRVYLRFFILCSFSGLFFYAIKFLSIVGLDQLVISRLFRIFNDPLSEPRVELYSRMISQIGSNPFGYGFGNQESYTNAHPHNLFLEFILTFGLPVGLFISGILIYLVVRCRTYLRSKNLFFEETLLLSFSFLWMISNDLGSAYFLISMIAITLSQLNIGEARNSNVKRFL